MGTGSDSDSSATAVRRRRSRGLRAEADAFLRAHNGGRRSNPPASSAAARRPASPPSPAPRSPLPAVDAARLSKFRENARSFLDQSQRPGEERIAFQKLHEEAVHFLDDAAARKVTPKDSLLVAKGQGRYTAMRIRRDKQRLEQQYLAAMSFLDKADAGDSRVLIEEQELGDAALEENTAAAEKRQLENYAREAMSFLDKAFNQDESVLIDDEEPDIDYPDHPVYSQQHGIPEMLDHENHNSSRFPPRDDQPGDSGEAASIAHDRRELERYAEEYGDFLEKAYVDDTTVIVDDSESQASASDRGLFGRVVLPSPSSSQGAYADDLSDACTDDEFQDPTVAESVRRSAPLRSPGAGRASWDQRSPGVESNSSAQDQMSTRLRMERYEEEADEFFKGTNIPDEVEEDTDEEEVFVPPEFEPGDARVRRTSSARSMSDSDDELDTVTGLGTAVAEEDYDDDFGADQQILDDVREVDEEEEVEDVPKSMSDASGSRENGSSHSTPYLDRKREIRTPRRSPYQTAALPPAVPRSSPERQPTSGDMTVKVFAPDQADGGKEWTEVPLEPSFYRKLKRGSTVQIMPRPAAVLEGHGPAKSRSQGGIMLSARKQGKDIAPQLSAELQKMANERDAVIGALEEIVNERNKIAAQVGEMREMIAEAVGQKQSSPTSSRGDESVDIDLSEELQSAYDTMRKMTEETELTINVLENKYEEIAEEKEQLEKLLEEHQAENDELREQIIVLKRDGSGKKCTECRDMVQLRAAVESSKIAANEAAIGRAELEKKLREIKREMQTKQRNAAARHKLIAEDQRELQIRYAELEAVRDSDRLALSEMESKLDESLRRTDELKTALDDSESNLLKERLESQGMAERQRSIPQLEADALAAGVLREEVRETREQMTQLSEKLLEAEEDANRLRQDLLQANADNDTVRAELRTTRAQYEESLRARAATASQSIENAELQRALKEAQQESRAREEVLRKQMRELKELADNAVSAAAAAEQNAADAAEAATTAQDNAKVQIELEKIAKRELESKLLTRERELQAKVEEAKQWEKYAREQAEGSAAHGDTGGLVPSGSRRGIGGRRAHARSPEWRGRPKKEGSASGASGNEEHAGRKKKKNFSLFG